MIIATVFYGASLIKGDTNRAIRVDWHIKFLVVGSDSVGNGITVFEYNRISRFYRQAIGVKGKIRYVYLVLCRDGLILREA